MININEIKEKSEYCLNCKVKPCSKGCPLGNDIPSFIKCIKDEKYEEAYKILSNTTVLQSICGRICPHMSQCQGSCVRGIKSVPVSIGDLEAFVGDMAIENNYKIEKLEENGKKVAVIGGGPSGLTCAAFLARNGYNVTIYEKYNELGGILVHGIPEFRLPKEVVKKAINKILDLGINVQYNKEVGKNLDLKELKQEYNAIYLAIGANIPSKMMIPGEELEGVYGGNSLLETGEHPDYTGKHVAVIGGGNVAMDCARTINKMGAASVTVIYRRAEKQMPAEQKEIEDAKKEGVEFLFQNNILKINGNENGKVESIECIKTELVKKEGETREVPVNIEGSNYIKKMDYVIMAVGSKPETEIVEKLGVELSSKKYVKVDENYMTSEPGIYAGGDLIGQKATVAWAARAGRKAAEKIMSN